MAKVKELQTDIQYIMNVLSARGEQKAFESLENVLTTLGYKPQSNPQIGLDGMYGVKLNTVGELRDAMSELQDEDQICIATCDEHGDEQDHYPMYVDVYDGIQLLDGSTVNEVRFCQMPNSAPDTRDKGELIDAVIKQLMQDYYHGDETCWVELLEFIPWEILKNSLPEDQWKPFDEITKAYYDKIDNVRDGATLIPVPEKKIVLKCQHCTSDNVQVQGWVRPNEGMKYVDMVCEGDMPGWCCDCELSAVIESEEIPATEEVIGFQVVRFDGVGHTVYHPHMDSPTSVYNLDQAKSMMDDDNNGEEEDWELQAVWNTYIDCPVIMFEGNVR